MRDLRQRCLRQAQRQTPNAKRQTSNCDTAKKLASAAEEIGYIQKNKTYFDTLYFEAGNRLESVKEAALQSKINFSAFFK